MQQRCCLPRLVVAIFEEITCILISDLAAAAGDLQYTLGNQEDVHWDAGVGPGLIPILRYKHTGDTGEKNVQITLICDENTEGDLITTGERPTQQGYYDFQLTSKCVCWNKCKGEQL